MFLHYANIFLFEIILINKYNMKYTIPQIVKSQGLLSVSLLSQLVNITFRNSECKARFSGMTARLLSCMVYLVSAYLSQLPDGVHSDFSGSQTRKKKEQSESLAE